MKKSFICLCSGALIAATAFQSCKNMGGGQPVDLKLNLQPGSKYTYSMETKTAMSQTAMGQTMKTNQDMTMETTYDVSGTEGANKKITVTYDRIAMNMKNNMMSMQYDSRDATKQDSMFRGMGNMLNKPFTMTVTDKGEILHLEGLSDIVNSLGDTTTPQGATMRKQMKSTFNDTTIRAMMQQSLNIFPDKPVTPGDTWKKTYNMGMGFMNLRVDNDFKLDKVTDGVAHIIVTSKITGSGGNMPEMKNMKIEMAGDQKGNMDVEVASGLVKDSKMTQKIKGSISAMGMQIPMDVTTDIHITGKKK